MFQEENVWVKKQEPENKGLKDTSKQLKEAKIQSNVYEAC